MTRSPPPPLEAFPLLHPHTVPSYPIISHPYRYNPRSQPFPSLLSYQLVLRSRTNASRCRNFYPTKKRICTRPAPAAPSVTQQWTMLKKRKQQEKKTKETVTQAQRGGEKSKWQPSSLESFPVRPQEIYEKQIQASRKVGRTHGWVCNRSRLPSEMLCSEVATMILTDM